MLTLILFALPLLASLSLIGALPRVRGTLLFISLGTAWLGASGIFTKSLVDGLQTHARATELRWAERNWIVVLGGGVVRWPDGQLSSPILSAPRLLEARRLYKECDAPGRSCFILTSGGDPAHAGQSEAETMARELNRVGVPRDRIVTEDRSLNTIQNARYAWDLITHRTESKDPPGTVVLVTSGLHLTRALIYFSQFGPRPVAAPADHAEVRPSWLPKSYNLILLDIAIHEWLGIARAQVYRAFDWSLPGGAAGSP